MALPQIRGNIEDGSGFTTISYVDVDTQLLSLPSQLQQQVFNTYELFVGGATPPGSQLYLYLEMCSGSGPRPSLYTCTRDCHTPQAPYSPSNANSGPAFHSLPVSSEVCCPVVCLCVRACVYMYM